MDVNATSVFLGTTHVVPHLRKAGGGAIVNICSIMGMVGSASGHPAYRASEAAARNYTKAAAYRYGRDWIRVNAIMPGYFLSMLSSARLHPGGTERTTIEELALQLPIRRIGRWVELGYAAVFLASDEAEYITGIELAIDGGYVAR